MLTQVDMLKIGSKIVKGLKFQLHIAKLRVIGEDTDKTVHQITEIIFPLF